MTHRVHPHIFRIGTTKTWKSRWFGRGNYFVESLREDTLLRERLWEKLRHSHVETIEIERVSSAIQVAIKTSRPGLLIGRSGEGAERLKGEIQKTVLKIRKRFGLPPKKQEVKLTIEEIRQPETHSAIVAEMLVEDLEKRTPFRRAMKQMINKVAASKDVKGVKISLKGRLDGAEMARYEWLKKGRIPLQTLRADVDYAERTAFTTYGTIGVKVWIYKGDVFEQKQVK